MSFSRDENGRARLGAASLSDLLDAAPTPFYVYDVDAIEAAARALQGGFGNRKHLVCYAAKANSAGRILRRLASAGVGADVVSGGELALCLAAGFVPDRVVYSGVAKTDAELDAAIAAGERGVLAVQLESIEEAARLAARARALGRVARVSLRLNPGVAVDTHAHIATGHDEAKFGIPLADLGAALEAVLPDASLVLAGVATHIGSQMTTTGDFVVAGRAVCEAARACESRGARLAFVDFGGGFGIDYGGGCEATPADFARAAVSLAAEHRLDGATLLCEPGRSIVGPYGALVARVIQTKRWKHPTTAGWLFVDAGMNDLLRPALYGADHRIEPLTLGAGAIARWRVAGPVCESSDDFGAYPLPDPPPDAIVIRDVGAYGYTMASAYNGRGMTTEVFVEGGRVVAVHRASDAAAWARERLEAGQSG